MSEMLKTQRVLLEKWNKITVKGFNFWLVTE